MIDEEVRVSRISSLLESRLTPIKRERITKGIKTEADIK